MGAPPTDPPASDERRGERRSREVRLGIVMYGGVSLAIYIYGVAHELFRAVRGRGVYKLLKAVTDSDIVVDVISGTSAGGINGILLGYALCNERELGDAAALWREHGDLGTLIRHPATPIGACTSVLEGEPGYQTKVEGGFLRTEPIRGTDDAPSPVDELDLFVTGTDVNGVLRTVFDDAGHPIDVKDHRAVFLLKHRAGRRHPFSSTELPGGRGGNADTVGALAKLARLTSCFPVAFEPVKVVTHGAGGGRDAWLAEWGGLATRGDSAVPDQTATHFLDGGVLDNKPFTYTIGAIFSRAATVDVDRRLLYVEPDPETFAAREGVAPPETGGREGRAPTVVEAALAALVTIPGYESISDDLRLIGERNSKIEQYRRVVRLIDDGSLRAWAELAPETRRLHTRTRLVRLTERVVEGVLNRNGVRHLLTRDEKAVASRLIGAFDSLVEQLVDAPGASPSHTRADGVLGDVDVYFRQRRLYRIVYLIHALRAGLEPNTPRARQYAAVLAAANRQLELYEILCWAMEGLVDRAPFPWTDPPRTWEMVYDALTRLLDDASRAAAQVPQRFSPSGWLAGDELKAFHRELTAARDVIGAAVAAGGASTGPGVPGPSLLRRLDRLETEMLALVDDPLDPLRRAYETFPSLDALVYPLQLMSGVMEQDVIRTTRISPADAQRGFSRRAPGDKISGDALHHFGGFVKASWRSNDILWGRLDGLCQLVETVLTEARLEQIGRRKDLAGAIAEQLAGELDPARLFPRSGPVVHDTLRLWFRRLFDTSDFPALKIQADARRELDSMLSLLVEAAQLEVMGEGLDDVVNDALKEQGRWNAYKVAAGDAGPRYDARHWRFEAGASGGDPLLAAVGAMVTARTVVTALGAAGERPATPRESGLGKFFADDYRVGSEQIADLPPLVMLELGLKATRALRKCLAQAYDGGEGGGRGVVMYASGALLALAHLVTVVTRRAPEEGRALSWAVVAASVMTLILGVAYGLAGRGITSFIGFVLAPIIVIAGVLFIAYLQRAQGRERPG
jgi:patatin-related protein